MEALIFILLLSGVLFFIWRLYLLKRTLRDMARSAWEARPFILETPESLNRSYHLRPLQAAIAELVQENKLARFGERESKWRIETTFGHLREGVLLINEKNRVVFANAAARMLLPEGDRRSLLDMQAETLVPAASFQTYAARLRSGEQPPREEIRIENEAGTRCYELSGSLFRDPNYGAETFLLFVLHDISELRRLEEVRREFVANVSHELKTPITILKGFSEAVSEDFDAMPDAQKRQFVEKINKSANRLQSIVEDLLTLSRLEGNPDSVRLEECGLHAFVGQFLEDYRERFSQHGIALVFEPGNCVDRVRIDPVKFSLVLQNLLENTLKHARQASRVRVFTEPANEGMIRLCVEDDGCGIPETELPRVFERFYRVDKSRSRDSGGTGLGLSIVRHIVSLHGGQVHVARAEPRGTRFSLTLPLV